MMNANRDCRRFVRLSACLPAALAAVAAASTEPPTPPRPNVLVIMADDCTYNDLPIHGGAAARTPAIDDLARSGLVFEQAFVGMSMCVPCRAELFTGQYAFGNGCVWNHAPCRGGTRSLPHHLGRLGYRVGIAGKVHVQPQASFPFDAVEGFDPDCVRNPTLPHSVAGIRRFMSSPAAAGDADRFCLVVALVEPHIPWVMGDAAAHPPDTIRLPANLVDTPRTRQDFARYLAEVEFMDRQVGEVLDALRETGHADDTLVLFTSEQGAQFPGNKWTCWNTGLHTALVARWPGVVAAGGRTTALVQYADVAPTLVELAGGDPADPSHGFDGTSFAAVLRGASVTHRLHAYGIHDNVPEGPPYPIRTVTDGRWRYVRNLAATDAYVEKHIMRSPDGPRTIAGLWSEWVEVADRDAAARRLVERFTRRPAEELYDTEADPFELVNLVADPARRAERERLSAELDRWLAAQGDPGAALDTPEALAAARAGRHTFPGPARAR
jgi:N-sulfoglucosamine sulfohydrolase